MREGRFGTSIKPWLMATHKDKSTRNPRIIIVHAKQRNVQIKEDIRIVNSVDIETFSSGINLANITYHRDIYIVSSLQSILQCCCACYLLLLPVLYRTVGTTKDDCAGGNNIIVRVLKPSHAIIDSDFKTSPTSRLSAGLKS
jgi:hypothetical protein